jgi:hypothetical protein
MENEGSELKKVKALFYGGIVTKEEGSEEGVNF